MNGRSRFRLRIRYAVAIVAAAYLYRGLVIRGGDLMPDLPQDVLVFGLAIVLFGAVWFLRRTDAAREPEHMDAEVDDTGHDHCGDDG